LAKKMGLEETNHNDKRITSQESRVQVRNYPYCKCTKRCRDITLRIKLHRRKVIDYPSYTGDSNEQNLYSESVICTKASQEQATNRLLPKDRSLIPHTQRNRKHRNRQERPIPARLLLPPSIIATVASITCDVVQSINLRSHDPLIRLSTHRQSKPEE